MFSVFQVFVAHSVHLWIVDSGATDHIACDRTGFVEYRRVLAGRKVLMGNNSSIGVLRIGSCKLEM